MKKNILKRIVVLICALSLFFSVFCVSAADEKSDYIVDNAGILTDQTKSYIEENLKAVEDRFNGHMYFVTLDTDTLPNKLYASDEIEGIDSLSNDDGNGDKIIILWASESNLIKLYKPSKPQYDNYNYVEVIQLIADSLSDSSDEQAVIRDSFSIYVASEMFYENDEKHIPDTLTVGTVKAREIVEKNLEKTSSESTAIGIGVVVVILIVIVIIFGLNKTPQGKIKPDGSNFKGGYGSGSGAMTNMPGQMNGPGFGNFGSGGKF